MRMKLQSIRLFSVVGAALVSGLAAGCPELEDANRVWFEAEIVTGEVESQGPGQALVLGCDPNVFDQPCVWNVTVRLSNAEPISRWSLELSSVDVGGDALSASMLSIVEGAFTAPTDDATAGAAPNLIRRADASNDSDTGAPSALYDLATFVLTYDPANDDQVNLFASTGEAGWVNPLGIAPFVRFGGDAGVLTSPLTSVPRAVIVINQPPGSQPGEMPDGEDCDAPGDEDGDGRVNCDDSDCRDHASCEDAPRVTCPASTTAECDGEGNTGDLNAWLASVSVASQCGGLELTNDFDGLSAGCGETGTAVVTFEASDDCGRDQCTATFEIVDTTNPALELPFDLVFMCEPGTEQTELRDWLNSGSASDGCGAIASLTTERAETNFQCAAGIRWEALDACGNRAVDEAFLRIEGDESAPELALEGDAAVTLECGVDSYAEPGAVISDDCDLTIPLEIGGNEVDTGEVGIYVVTYDARDLCGREADRVDRVVTVVDTLPPRVEFLPAVELWPPNGMYRALSISDCARLVDDCDGELDIDAFGQVLSIYSDEPENGTGDGNTADDIVIDGTSSFRLRSERRGGGNGRVYGVTFRVDYEDVSFEETCRIEVPHDQSGAGAVDDGAGSGYTVTP